MSEWHDVDRQVFERDILPANRPAVLRGVVRNWPVVAAGRDSPERVADYVKRFDTGGLIRAYVGPPDIDGRFFYAAGYKGFNFDAKDVSLSAALDTMISLLDETRPPAIALQAIDVADRMPGFRDENSLSLLAADVGPRFWLSNRSTVAAHFDINHNIACVVSGTRRFTVFPPEQAANLYIGPLLTTPGGPPISVVDLRNPDFERFPRIAEALESAEQATLEPGDAIFVPVLWWHSVESLDALNILVNHWWNEATSMHHDPMLALVHGMVLMSEMPAAQRNAWRALFDCFVFRQNGDPGAHLPADIRDVMGQLSAADREYVLSMLVERMRS